MDGCGVQEHLCFDARMHLQEKKDRLLSVSNELLDSVDHEAEEKERLLLERSGSPPSKQKTQNTEHRTQNTEHRTLGSLKRRDFSLIIIRYVERRGKVGNGGGCALWNERRGRFIGLIHATPGCNAFF